MFGDYQLSRLCINGVYIYINFARNCVVTGATVRASFG